MSNIKYDYLKCWKATFVTIAPIVFIYNGAYYLHSANQKWINSPHFSILNTLQFLLIDQLLIESISCVIILYVIRIFSIKYRLTKTPKNSIDLLWYGLKFLPLLLSVYFLFAPVTLSVRYLYHLLMNNPGSYFQSYFFLSPPLYITYLPVTLAIGYTGLSVNLLHNRFHSVSYNLEATYSLKRELIKQETQTADSKTALIELKDEFGPVAIPIHAIRKIQKVDRKYIVQVENRSYYTSKTLAQLEEALQIYGFIRVNRSIILPLYRIESFTFWKHDKYILRLDSAEEVVVSRDKMRMIKEIKMAAANSNSA